MAVFVELTTDAFEQVLSNQQAKRSRGSRSRRAGRRVARRPTRGLELKEDTYGAVKVIQADGTEIPLTDSSSPDGKTSSGYANFILQQVQEQRMEKHQVVETFGASYIHFFGENPRFLNVQAVLINSHDFNWEAEWWENYEQYFRGTRLVELGARMYLFYDDNIVEGYMLNCAAVKLSTEQFLVQMNFQMFITSYRNVSFIGDPNFPIRASAYIPPGIELTGGRAAEDLTVHYQGAALDTINSESVGVKGNDIRDIINEGGIGQRKKLSAFLREMPPTYAVAPDVQAAINRVADQVEGINLTDLVFRSGRPLRSLIANNIDEYVGQDGNTYFGFGDGSIPNSLTPTIRSQLEAEDLFFAAISFLSCYGANLDTPSALSGIGLSARVDAKLGATFQPQSGAGFGYGLSALAEPTTSYSSSLSQDPLGAVYGRSVVDERQKDNRFVQGAGDADYGYRSDFVSGPGFGQAGFGSFGGSGYGGGLGAAGDPGFKDPSKFTLAGVQDNRSAFERFLKPRQDSTVFGSGIGIGASTTGLAGGASFAIGGKPSAFAVVSLDGILDVTGSARSSAQARSDLTAERLLGFGQSNLGGTPCPAPAGSFGELTLSVGGGFGIGSSVGVSAGFKLSIP